MLQENRYQESVVSKIFIRITNNYLLASVPTTNASHRYLKEKDQNGCKVPVR